MGENTNSVGSGHVEPNTMKRRMVLLMKYLYEETDEQHTVTTYDIIDYMAEHGIKVNRKTIKPDIDLLTECGMDIVTISSKPNRYFWGSRQFQMPELKLLLDAVASSRFITGKKSSELSRKLVGLASIHQRKQLGRHIYTNSLVKPRNERIYYIVDRINDAIESGSRIRFRYTEYDGNKKKVLRNHGEIYELSPYALYWNDDFYYVIGWSDKHDSVIALRVDRLFKPEVTDEPAHKRPKGFKVSDYSHKIFEMFDGEEVVVTMRCRNELMKYIVDRFGESVTTEPSDGEYFICRANVRLSPTFYGWVFGFGGGIRITAPEEAVEQISEMARNML